MALAVRGQFDHARLQMVDGQGFDVRTALSGMCLVELTSGATVETRSTRLDARRRTSEDLAADIVTRSTWPTATSTANVVGGLAIVLPADQAVDLGPSHQQAVATLVRSLIPPMGIGAGLTQSGERHTVESTVELSNARQHLCPDLCGVRPTGRCLTESALSARFGRVVSLNLLPRVRCERQLWLFAANSSRIAASSSGLGR